MKDYLSGAIALTVRENGSNKVQEVTGITYCTIDNIDFIELQLGENKNINGK